MQNYAILRAAALSGVLAVAIGAFGAHGLKPHLSDYQLDIFDKGVHYQFIHTLAMLFAGWQFAQSEGRNGRFKLAGWLFLAGIVCFSGSLYLLACRDLISVSVAWAGPVTPLGGLCFIGGWGAMFLGFSKLR